VRQCLAHAPCTGGICPGLGTVPRSALTTSMLPPDHPPEASPPRLHEVLAIWVALGAILVAVFVTYARVPPSDLYHVSGSGLTGGASRALVTLNYPISIIAIALLGVVVARLFAVPGALTRRGRAAVAIVAGLATALCLVTGFPGVVQQKDLDAKWINVVPAIGVLLALALTAYAVRRTGLGTFTPWSRGDPLRLVLPLGLLGLLAALGSYWRARHLWPALVAVILGGLAFLPSVATLTYENMQNGPRLLYVASPAAATFWGLLPMLRWRSARATLAWRAGTLALLALVVVQSVLFVERRMVMLEYGTELHEQIIALGERHAGETVLLLNVPSWFAPKTQEFPRGHLGVQLHPYYIDMDTLIYAGSGQRVRVESRHLAPDVNGWRYDFEAHGPFIGHPELDERLRAGVPAYIVDLYHDRLALRSIGSLSPGQPAPSTWEATFAESLLLVEHEVALEDGLLQVTTTWYVTQPLPNDARPRYEVRGPDGSPLLVHERYALSDMAAPRLWQPGDRVQDELVLDLAPLDLPAMLTITLAVVEVPSGTPLPLTTPDGARHPDGVLVLE
jgi:hypothetical protein